MEGFVRIGVKGGEYIVARLTGQTRGLTRFSRFELQMDGISSRQWFKTVAYKSEIIEFKEVLARIGKRQGWELKDLQRQFSNHVWDEIFFDA